MQHDAKTGFLTGIPINADGEAVDEQTQLLESIRGDTSDLVGVARAQLRALHQATATPAGRSGTASNWMPRGALGALRQSTRVAVPARRGTSVPAMSRDAAGRFIGRTTPTGQAETRLSDFSAAIESLAATNERQRRDERADKRAAPAGSRDAGGRFQSEGRQPGALLARAGLKALGDISQVDPLLGAASEAHGLLSKVGAVATPMGRSSGGGGEGQPVGLLRKVWRELRAMRKADATSSRTTLAKLAALGKARAGGESGGGLLGMLASLLPSLPAVLGPLAAIVAGAGAAGAAFSVIGKVLKRLPVLVEAITGAFEDRKLQQDLTLTPVERHKSRLVNAGGMGGGVAGAMAGAVAGQAMIPIPVVGAVIGAVAGGYMGSKAGKAIGGGTAKATERWAGGAKDDIVQGSAKAGVDPGLVAQIANFESGFDSEAKPIRNGIPMSSAHGYGQMLDATWVDMVRKRGEKHGVVGAANMTKDQSLGLRGDKKLQAGMLSELTADNVKLGRSLGGKDDAANVYALHNLGAGDGGKFLKALKSSPDAPVSDILSKKVIENNPSLYKGGSISVGEAYATMGKKMAAGDKYAADARGAAPPIVAAAPGAATAKAKTPAPAAAVAAAVPAGAPVATTAAVAMPKALAVPPAPAVVAMAAIPAMPQMDAPGPQRVNSAPGAGAAALAPSAPPSQDVRDRLIAHVVTGGMGGYGGTAHR